MHLQYMQMHLQYMQRAHITLHHLPWLLGTLIIMLLLVINMLCSSLKWLRKRHETIKRTWLSNLYGSRVLTAGSVIDG